MSTAKTPIPGGGKTPTKNGAGKKSTAKTPASKSPTKSTTKAKNSVKTPAPPKLGDKESSSVRPESEADSVFLRSGSLKQQGLSGKRSRNPSGTNPVEKEGSFNSSSSHKSASEEAWER